MSKQVSDTSALEAKIKRIGNEELSAKLISLASTDSAFRARLLSDPRATISSLVGVPLPEAVNIKVIEDTASSFTLVLPPAKVATEDAVEAGHEEPDMAWKTR